MKDMVKFIEEAIKDLDVFVEKRGDRGYIVVANKLRHLSRRKNIVTYWPTSCSVGVIILGLLPRKTFHSVEEMKEYKVAEKIRSKYDQMVG